MTLEDDDTIFTLDMLTLLAQGGFAETLPQRAKHDRLMTAGDKIKETAYSAMEHQRIYSILNKS